MARTLYFSAFVEPGTRHAVAFDSYATSKTHRGDQPNVLEVIAEYYSDEGDLLFSHALDHLAPLTHLRTDFDKRAVVSMRVNYASVIPFNVYGFVFSSDDTQGTAYPINAAIGYPDEATWLNRLVMPLTAPPSGWCHELLIGNVSRWAPLRYRLALYGQGKTRLVSDDLRPRAHRIYRLEDLALQHGFGTTLDGIALIARNKAISYVIGRNRATDAISFMEHMISQPRTNYSLSRPKAYVDSVRDGSGNPLTDVFCYCSGVNLGDALAGKVSEVGNYCTGCRDDLRVARQLLAANPKLTDDPDALSRALALFAHSR